MKPLLLPLLLAFATLSANAQSAEQARVIVKFKSEASAVRARALAAGAGASATAQVLGERAGTLGGRVGWALSAGQAVGERTQVVTAEGLTSAELAAKLAADSDVEYAEPDRRMRAFATPNDTFFLSGDSAGPAVGQWYLRNPATEGAAVAAINAVGAWDLSKAGAAGSGVIVAVLDTGVRAEHPDLAGKVLAGYDMVSDTGISNDGNGRDADASDPGDWVSASEANVGKFGGCDRADSSWHGTQVSGIIGALTDNASGMAGAGWNARVLPVRVLGKCYGMESDIAAGIRWAAGLAVDGVPTNTTPAKVINLSLGGTGSCSRTYQDAINAAVGAGVTVVVAAGNTAGHAVGAPGNCNNVITVAALRHVGTKVGYSDVGTQVTLSAPGGNCVNVDDTGPCEYPILTTLNAGTTVPGASIYSNGSTHPSVGTSFSSPQVAATAALMLASDPSLTPATVKTLLQRSARAFPTSGVAADTTGPIVQCRAPNGIDQLQCYCTTTTCGAGMLDASAAVALAQTVDITPAIAVSAAPAAESTVSVSAAAATVAAGRTVASIAWTLVDGGGIVTAFTSGANATVATFVPTGAGTVVVRATVTDSLGYSASVDHTITVAAASSGSSGGGGGGGGSVGAAWLGLLALGAAALRRRASAR